LLWQQAWVLKKLNDSDWLAEPQNPHFGAKNLGPMLNWTRFIVNFVWKFADFRYHGNGVGLSQISLTQLSRQTPKTLYLAQELWWYLIYKLSYSQFSDEIYQFLFPWQQGWVYQKFEWLCLIGQTPKPPVWCKILGPILNASWVVVIFVWKFQNFCYHGNRGWSDTIFTYTVKSADPENPLFGARILMISHIQAEL